MAEAKKVFDFSLLRRVFVFVKHYQRFFYLSLVLAVLMALTAPVRPYLIQLTVNTAIGKNQVIPAWVKTILLGIDL